MARTLTLAATPARLLLVLAMLLLAAAVIGVGANWFEPRSSAVHQPQPFAAPPAGSAAQAQQAADQPVTVPDSQRSVTGVQGQPVPTPAQTAPSATQTNPTTTAGCSANPPAGRNIGVCAIP